MIPTLVGRWQLRFLLLATAGLVITLFFGWLYGNMVVPLTFLVLVLVFGWFWDIIYHYITGFRWDHDWPPAYQVAAGIFEGLFIWGFVLLLRQFIPYIFPVTFGQFVAHYGTVWLAVFLLAQGPIRVVFPRLRYRGGRWL